MKQQWVVLCYVFTSSRREREETGTGSNTVTISISDLTDVQLGFDGDIPERRESAGGPSRAIEYNSGWDEIAEKERYLSPFSEREGNPTHHRSSHAFVFIILYHLNLSHSHLTTHSISHILLLSLSSHLVPPLLYGSLSASFGRRFSFSSFCYSVEC